MSYKTIRFERQKLFEQVWEKPMIKLAAEYGLSDVGLRKICKRLGIPLPQQGYFLRTYKEQRPTLTPIKNGKTEYTAHIYKPERLSEYEPAEVIDLPEIAFEEMPENRIIVPETLMSPHSLIVETKNNLNKTKEKRYGRLTKFSHKSEYISVFPESLDRALRLMNTLFKSFTKRNYPFFIDKGTHFLVVKIMDEQLFIRLEERSRQIPHITTATELKESKHRYIHIPKYDYFSTGEFAFLYFNGYSPHKVLKDDKQGRIEGKLNDLIIILVKKALQIKDDRIRRQREELARWEMEKRRLEMEHMIRKEKKRLEILREQCNAWHEAQRLRIFIKAARDKFPVLEPESNFAKWLAWASLQAEHLDPLNAGMPTIFDDDQ